MTNDAAGHSLLQVARVKEQVRVLKEQLRSRRVRVKVDTTPLLSTLHETLHELQSEDSADIDVDIDQPPQGLGVNSSTADVKVVSDKKSSSCCLRMLPGLCR